MMPQPEDRIPRDINPFRPPACPVCRGTGCFSVTSDPNGDRRRAGLPVYLWQMDCLDCQGTGKSSGRVDR